MMRPGLRQIEKPARVEFVQFGVVIHVHPDAVEPCAECDYEWPGHLPGVVCVRFEGGCNCEKDQLCEECHGSQEVLAFGHCRDCGEYKGQRYGGGAHYSGLYECDECGREICVACAETHGEVEKVFANKTPGVHCRDCKEAGK